MPQRRYGRTYGASLTPLAAKLNSRPQLSKITLANILSGDACTPISLSDFEAYLTYKEHSVEVLQFIVWFQDYRARYFAKPAPVYSPSGSKFLIPSSPFGQRTIKTSSESQCIDENVVGSSLPQSFEINAPEVISSPEPTVTTPTTPSSNTRSSLSPLLSSKVPLYAPSSNTSGNFFGLKNEDARLKEECARILTTFFIPGAPKELNLEQSARDTVIDSLASTTHPDVFLPIYEEMYDTLQTLTLPRFLAFATANINFTKQLLWYIIGMIDVLISIAIAIALIVTHPTPPQASRAWRLLAVPFASLGSMQTYAAWRGFCSQIFGRSSVQLHVWELQDMDEENKPFYDDLTSPSSMQSQPYRVPWDQSMEQPQTPSTAGMPMLPTERRISFAQRGNTEKTGHPLAGHGSSSVESFKRPPVFGPEKVILDPRIKAVHQKVLNDIIWFGGWFTLIFAAVVFSVPGR